MSRLLNEFTIWTHLDSADPVVESLSASGFASSVRVAVWRNRTALRAQFPGDDGLAYFVPETVYAFRRDVPETLTQRFGSIHFSLDSLRMGIISHECSHAALDWARRVQVDVHSQTGEELFAWVLGNFVRQICNATHDLRSLVSQPQIVSLK